MKKINFLLFFVALAISKVVAQDVTKSMAIKYKVYFNKVEDIQTYEGLISNLDN